MFNVSIFALLTAIAVIANVVAAPGLVRVANPTLPRDRYRIYLAYHLTNNILLSIGAAAVGAYMAPLAGISSPFFESLVKFDQPHVELLSILPLVAIGSIYVLGGVLLIKIFLSSRSVTSPDQPYPSIPMKILKEGIIEEIIYRWGLMSLVASILFKAFSIEHDAAIFIAILISALASAASHISDLYRCRILRLDLAIFSIISINFWSAAIYGWLFCQYGLATAIICHSMVIFVSSISHSVMRFFSATEPNY